MSLLEDEISSIPPESPTGPRDAARPKVNFLTVLKNSGFRNLWLGQIVSQIGDYFAFLALTVVVSSFSHDVEQATLQCHGPADLPSLCRAFYLGCWLASS